MILNAATFTAVSFTGIEQQLKGRSIAPYDERNLWDMIPADGGYR